MLASVPTVWLWLMAAAAIGVHSSAMALWIPLRKFRMGYPFIWILCGSGMLAVGRAQGFTLASMLIVLSFALIGLTIGMFPTRRLFTVWAHEIDEGVTRERYDYPRSHLAFCAMSVVVMSFAAVVLTTL
ncbi:hypothetical protein ACWCOZ_12010 [Streptomyces sp. NPDC001840]|uniref:hypothetical protein n=1 Tax=Streptomyces sp. NPDC059396 TaxID=3346819 RepID=UPI00367DBCC8